MVRVISVHHFDSQVIQTCEEPLAATTAPPDRILLALPHHVVEVHDLNLPDECSFCFPTVDRVHELRHCITVTFRITRRYLTTNQHVVAGSSTRATPRKTSNLKEQILDYLQTSSTLVNHSAEITPRLFRGCTDVPPNIYCVNEDSTEVIFDALKDHLSPKVPIFENCPGYGMLTKKLLELNPSVIRTFEPDPYFTTKMETIARQGADIVKLSSIQLLDLFKDEFKDFLDGSNRMGSSLGGISEEDWKSPPIVQMVGLTADYRTFSYLINKLTHQIGIFTYGRPAFFIYAPNSVYSRINQYSLTGKLPILYRDILFNIYYDYEVICTVDRKHFLPWPRAKDRKASTLDSSLNELHLMKVVPKKELQDVWPLDTRRYLWYFLFQAFLSRNTKIIPFLEKWIPGCGLNFIADGYTIFTEFRELSYDELLNVFMAFVNHPHFEDSPFPAAVDSHVFRSLNEALKEVTDDNPSESVEVDDKDDGKIVP